MPLSAIGDVCGAGARAVFWHSAPHAMLSVTLAPLGRLREELQEFFWLPLATRRSAELTALQRDAVRDLCDAARRRLSVASGLGERDQIHVALSLFREASRFLVLAFVVSKDPHIDTRALGPAAAVDAFDQALRGEGIAPPPVYESLGPLLVDPDLLAVDGLSVGQARTRLGEFQAATGWLSALSEPRSPPQVKRARLLRVSVGAVTMILLLALIAVWIGSPENVALNKVARSSSVDRDHAPAAAVDGEKNGRFGFHSTEEDAPWWSVDLARRYAIGTVKIFGRGDGAFDQSVPLALEVSDDGVSFKKVAERTDPFSEADPWVVRPSQVVGRFVRVQTERHSFLVLGEVEVYGRPR